MSVFFLLVYFYIDYSKVETNSIFVKKNGVGNLK